MKNRAFGPNDKLCFLRAFTIIIANNKPQHILSGISSYSFSLGVLISFIHLHVLTYVELLTFQFFFYFTKLTHHWLLGDTSIFELGVLDP